MARFVQKDEKSNQIKLYAITLVSLIAELFSHYNLQLNLLLSERPSYMYVFLDSFGL